MKKLVIHGADSSTPIPGLETLAADLELAFAPDEQSLARVLPGAEILLGWDFRGKDLQACWHLAKDLRWIQWCGAGVDAMLFPELAQSDVMLTNARGVYDAPMAEYALALILAQAKGLPDTLRYQAAGEWQYRISERIAGRRVVIVGVGSIARATARLLKAAGMEVVGVGRSARDGVPEFGTIHGIDALHAVVADAHWVVAILPGTSGTTGIFDAAFFAAMGAGGRFVNLGRGSAVDEVALLDALRSGHLAGAALDVYRTEPLPSDSPIWTAPNIICSPHMSADTDGFERDLVALFRDNLARYRQGQPLRNLVDKGLGFVTDAP